MSNTDSYYPRTLDGRAHWWQNIADNAQGVLQILGYTTPQIAPTLGDAAWGVYCYGTIPDFFADTTKALTAFRDAVLTGGTARRCPPCPPFRPCPLVPAASVLSGVEAGRILWVQQLKNNANYNASVGAQLGVETPSTPFDPTTYVCQLIGLACHAPHTVGGKFRKAGGHVDGINLYGRKEGATAWTLLGRYNATPFTAQVTVASGAPESWEFYAMAVKADVEFGVGSTIFPVIVRP